MTPLWEIIWRVSIQIFIALLNLIIIIFKNLETKEMFQDKELINQFYKIHKMQQWRSIIYERPFHDTGKS